MKIPLGGSGALLTRIENVSARQFYGLFCGWFFFLYCFANYSENVRIQTFSYIPNGGINNIFLD